MKYVVLSHCLRAHFLDEAGVHLEKIPVPAYQEQNIQPPSIINLTSFVSIYGQIELIIIPDHYIDDEEVLQTIQVRDNAYGRKYRGGIIMTATDAEAIMKNDLLPSALLNKIYKISTIRHGFMTETSDPNKILILNLAKRCIAEAAPLREITLRCCHGAGSPDDGLIILPSQQLIGQLGKSTALTNQTQVTSRAFLNGHLAFSDHEEYHRLKKLTIRTQTYDVSDVGLSDPICPNVLYDMHASLKSIPELRHLSVKSYYGVVNPVPVEKNKTPIYMGQWFSRDRPPSYAYPKAVRIKGHDDEDVTSLSILP